jgi:hypothetical protein
VVDRSEGRGPGSAGGHDLQNGHGVLGWLLVAAAFAVGTLPLHDNSLFTHLATGRLIWDGHLPHADPYTFTAHGDPWVVQSWFVSLVIGGLERLVSLAAVRVFFGLATAAGVALCWRLTAALAHQPLVRLAVAVPVTVMAVAGWTHRPYVVAFAGLAVVLLVLDGRVRPAVLVPVMWLWVNSHGSWPLAIAVVAFVWLGARLDRADTTAERATARWMAAGLAVSVLNPYGVKIFSVPFEALARRETFGHIVEWRAPSYTTVEQLAFLVVVAGAVLVLSRGARWRDALPVVVFLLAGVYSARNVSPAAIVALPAVSRVLAGRVRARPLRIPAVPVAALAAVLALLGVAQVARTDDIESSGYPVAATDWLEDHDLAPTEATVVARDYVGNFFELVYGTDARVFVDDRFEVVPTQVADDFFELLDAGPGWEAALARYDPDAVLWEADAPLTQVLAASADWDIAYHDDEFVVAVPAG